MDEDISTINTNTRNEKMKNFFIKNRKNIIIFLSIIILLTLSYFVYEEIKKRNKIKLANEFNSLTLNYSTNKIETESKLIKIVEAKDSTYSPLALYFLVDNKIISNQLQINKLFDILIEDTKLEKEIKNLIIYKKGLFNSDFETENNLLQILNPLINSESIWQSHALYLMGEYFFYKNEFQKSKQFFEKIINLKNSNPIIKLDAQKRITSDFKK